MKAKMMVALMLWPFFYSSLSFSQASSDLKSYERGKSIYTQVVSNSDSCILCHGEKGEANDILMIPKISGLTPLQVEAMLNDYRGDVRQDQALFVMNAISKELSDQQVKDVSLYISSIVDTPKSSLEKGRDIYWQGVGDVVACSACHETPVQLGIASISGFEKKYLIEQLRGFAIGSRKDLVMFVMNSMARELSEEQINDVSLYIASLSPDPDMALKAQKYLALLEYKVGVADGIMGGNTRAAIKNFQQQKGLPVTGKLDSVTQKELWRAGRLKEGDLEKNAELNAAKNVEDLERFIAKNKHHPLLDSAIERIEKLLIEEIRNLGNKNRYTFKNFQGDKNTPASSSTIVELFNGKTLNKTEFDHDYMNITKTAAVNVFGDGSITRVVGRIEIAIDDGKSGYLIGQGDKANRLTFGIFQDIGLVYLRGKGKFVDSSGNEHLLGE